ncbi:MAG: hypothetical protein A2X16_00420 [Bacteroidetes bacterium GWF2_39_10]|nr:MAG: hypothetical protein A2X16_00420 [Bacteroidetes bacterium GWF2_39_10]
MNADVLLCPKNVKEDSLFGVVGAGRVAGCRAYALELVAEELLRCEVFVGCVRPKLFANLFVEPFGGGLCQTVAQYANHNGCIWVFLVGFEFLVVDFGGYHKEAEVGGDV